MRAAVSGWKEGLDLKLWRVDERRREGSSVTGEEIAENYEAERGY